MFHLGKVPLFPIGKARIALRKRTTITERGFLACGNSRVKSPVVDVLDGGETALEARRRKYGHSP